MSFLKGEGQGQLRDLLHLCRGFPIPRVLGASLTSTVPGPAPYSKSCKCSNIKRARKMQTDLLSSRLFSGHQREREKVLQSVGQVCQLGDGTGLSPAHSLCFFKDMSTLL